MKNLIFAFNICRYVKSNAIVLACDKSTVGIGSGQPSRVDSCQIAINKMNANPVMLSNATPLSLCLRQPINTAVEVVGTTKNTIQR